LTVNRYFPSIPRKDREVAQCPRRVELHELALGDIRDPLEWSREAGLEERIGIF
jgi:hypothetical protein